MRRLIPLAAVALLGASASLAAGPSMAGPVHGHGLHPLVNRAGHAHRLAASPATTTSNLSWHSGPVLSSTTTYAIFWVPPGTSVSPNYESLIERYFTDVGGSPLYDLLTQYGEPTTNATLNKTTLGGAWVDTTPFPGGRGSVSQPLTDADVQAEVDRAITTEGWQSSPSTPDFFVFMPLNTYQAYDATDESFLQYCAYHGYYASTALGGATTLYASMPDIGTNLAACGVQNSVTPNGDAAADSEISTASHEQFETANDPYLDAWYDSAGNEIGDKCAYLYGPEDKNGGNVTLNGHRYVTQMEWSNGDSGCVINYPAQLAVSAPATAATATPVNVTVTARDSGGHTATGYTGTVSVTAAGATVAPVAHTYTAADNGTTTFAVTFSSSTSGTQTITATDSVTGISGSAAVTVGGSPPPPPPANDVIVNGGFETGAITPWTITGKVAVVTTPVHSGSYAARAGNVSPLSGTSTIMQKFVVPAGATSLSFWYDDVCTGSVASNDYVTVTLRDNSIGHTTTILAKTCSNTGSFVQVVVSLSGYANHKATLELISHDDGHATSYAFLDDAATG